MFYAVVSVLLVFLSMIQKGAELTIGYLIAAGLFAIASAIALRDLGDK